MNESRKGPQPDHPDAQAAQHLAHAHDLLTRLREQLEKPHPELDEAINKLESAMNLLTIKTGGLL